MKDSWDEDRKLLIKGRNQSFTRFKVQGSGLRWRLRRLFLLERCPEVAFKSRVTSHNNNTSSSLAKGRAKGAGWIHEAV